MENVEMSEEEIKTLEHIRLLQCQTKAFKDRITELEDKLKKEQDFVNSVAKYKIDGNSVPEIGRDMGWFVGLANKIQSCR